MCSELGVRWCAFSIIYVLSNMQLALACQHKALSKLSFCQSNMLCEMCKLVEKLANLYSLMCLLLTGGWGASKVAATQDDGVRPRGHRFKPRPRKPV